MDSSRVRLLIWGGLAAFLLFVGGVFVAVPRHQDAPLETPTQTPGMTVVGKPDVEQSRKTPTPFVPPVRTPSLPEVGAGWIVNEGTRAHQGPGLNHPVLATLRYGTRVRLMDASDGWQGVVLEDKTAAYVQSQFVSATRPTDLPQAGPAEAVKALEAYFQEINQRKFEKAYDRLSFEFKRALSYAAFQAGYSQSEETFCRVVKTEQIAPERIAMYVEILETEGRHRNAYKGTYVAELEQGEWKLAQGNLEPTDPDILEPFPSGAGTPEKRPFPDPTPDIVDE